jgi:predicted  nucleic acid-binding Zn-ribbon protein
LCPPQKMKRIDILVCSSEDVQKERSVAERSIREVAEELDVPVSVSYSDRLRGSSQEDETSRPGSDNQADGLLLCPSFREHQDSRADPEFCEYDLNPGQYDLVIHILWTRIGTRPAPMLVLPNGSQPGSAAEYEIVRALDQSKRRFPGLHVYRNRAIPNAPVEPKEKREGFYRHWDAVQEFCAAWEKNDATAFGECCYDYQDLEQFEDLFREHFCDFLTRQLDCQTGLGKALRKGGSSESNPFRGLDFFDFEHADLYHGQTKAVWEVLDALKNQAAAKKHFVLVMGPTGSGKSSLVRAGVLPLLTRGGTPLGKGSWRYAVTRPGSSGDPFDPLAAALLGRFALPELQQEESPIEWSNLAARLRKDPKGTAGRVAETLDQLTSKESDHLETDGLPAGRSETVELVRQKSRERIKLRFVLVVDQLEELFARGVSPVLQRKYISALVTLAACEGVFVIATLRSGFYGDFQQFPELVELTGSSGKYELQPPTRRGISNIVRFRAEAAGLRFEPDTDTGRSLDEALVEAAIASPEPLPLLEHLLSRLYRRQLDRKDGLLLWSDYRGLGELQNALAQHEKAVFSTLKSNEQQALRFVIRQLIVPGRSEEDHLIRRTVPYHALVSSPELNQLQRAGAVGLIDRLIEEGLLRADPNQNQKLLISIPQEALLRRWPGVWHWISEDRHFFEMRDRLDASRKLWLQKGRHTDDLLERGIGLAEAGTLLRNFRSSLNEGQIEYIQKSLAKQKRRRWVRDGIGLAAIAGLAGFAAFASIGQFNGKSQRKTKEDVQSAQQNAELANNQRSALETELKKLRDEKAQLAQQITDLTSQSSALGTQLKEANEKAQLAQQSSDQRSNLDAELKKLRDEKAQLAQQNADLTSQSSALGTQLKEANEKAHLAQQSSDQRSALEIELKKLRDEKAQLAQQITNLTSQSSALSTQLKEANQKAQLAQQSSDQRSALETELKKLRDEKAQLAQQNADLTSQSSALSTQLKEANQKAQLAQQSSNQRSALDAELNKLRDEKAQLAQQNANLTSQSSALSTQLKEANQKAQLAQQSSNQRSALETELNKLRDEKAQLAQQNADLTSQSSALSTQLKEANQKAQLAQQSSDQRSALETELKKLRDEKAQLAQQNADLTSQSSALSTQLKEANQKAQLAQQSSNQRSNLETELKKLRDEKAQLAQQNADLTSQSSALSTQLKEANQKAQLAQQNSGQRGILEAQLTKAEEMAHQAQQNADVATSQRNTLLAELEKTREEKTQLELQNADLLQNAGLTSSEQNTSESQVSEANGQKQQQTDLATRKKAQQTQSKKASSKTTSKNRTKKHSTSTKQSRLKLPWKQ